MGKNNSIFFCINSCLFRWKSEYRVRPNPKRQANNICDMCHRLHQVFPMERDTNSSKTNQTTEQIANAHKESTPYRKIYTDMYQWFVAGQCTSIHANNELDALVLGWVNLVPNNASIITARISWRLKLHEIYIRCLLFSNKEDPA